MNNLLEILDVWIEGNWEFNLNLKFICTVNVVHLTEVCVKTGERKKTIFLENGGGFCTLRCWHFQSNNKSSWQVLISSEFYSLLVLPFLLIGVSDLSNRVSNASVHSRCSWSGTRWTREITLIPSFLLYSPVLPLSLFFPSPPSYFPPPLPELPSSLRGHHQSTHWSSFYSTWLDGDVSDSGFIPWSTVRFFQSLRACCLLKPNNVFANIAGFLIPQCAF